LLDDVNLPWLDGTACCSVWQAEEAKRWIVEVRFRRDPLANDSTPPLRFQGFWTGTGSSKGHCSAIWATGQQQRRHGSDDL